MEAFDLNKGYCVTVSGLTDYTLEKRYNPNSVIGIRNLISEYEQYDQMDSVEKLVFWELMVRVDSVIPNSPAYKAGIQIGDIVTKINGAITNNDSWNADIGIHDPGEVLLFTIERNGNELELLVTVAHRDSVYSKD